MTESGYFSIRLHSFLLTLLGPMFTLLGQRSDPINLGHKSLIKNTFSSSAWLFCATYILEKIFFFFFYTETKHQFVFTKNTKHTKKISWNHCMREFLSQVKSSLFFLLTVHTTQWWKSSQSVRLLFNLKNLSNGSIPIMPKFFLAWILMIQWVDSRKSLALDYCSRFSPLCTSW